MSNKPYRELFDGLGTVVIDLRLPKSRLLSLEEKAQTNGKTVDLVIVDAINEYLVLSELSRRNGFTESMAQLHQQVNTLEKENCVLKDRLAQMERRMCKMCLTTTVFEFLFRKSKAGVQRSREQERFLLETMAPKDLEGGDLEYVEWYGECELLKRLQSQLNQL